MRTIPLYKFKNKRKEILKEFNLPTKIVGIPAPYISYFLVNFTKISSNQIALFWTFLQTVGISLIAFGSYGWTITGIIISHFAMMLDQVDGDMARAKRKSTIGGPYLDEISQVISRSLLILVLGIGLYNSGFSILYFYLGSITSFIFMFSAYTETKIKQTLLEKNKIEKAKEKSEKKSNLFVKKLLSYFRPAEPMNIVYIVLTFNLLSTASFILVAYSVIILLSFVKKFYFIYKNVGNLKNESNFHL